MEKILKEEKFKLKTRIEVDVTWDEKAFNKKITSERKDFENKLTEIANFINESLGQVILDSLKNV